MLIFLLEVWYNDHGGFMEIQPMANQNNFGELFLNGKKYFIIDAEERERELDEQHLLAMLAEGERSLKEEGDITIGYLAKKHNVVL